jgi:hypothetical protein
LAAEPITSRPSAAHFLAHVLSDHGEAQGAAVPFKPVERDVVFDESVGNEIRSPVVQQVDCRDQLAAQLLAPGGGRLALNCLRGGDYGLWAGGISQLDNSGNAAPYTPQRRYLGQL